MKKIIFYILSIFITFFYINLTFAVETIKVETPIDMSYIFEFCTGAGGTEEGGTETSNICNVPAGVGGFEIVIAGIVKYLLLFANLAGVLFIVINGVLYSMSGINESFKSEAKNRITKTLIGIILLLTSGLILNIIAPWVYK